MEKKIDVLARLMRAGEWDRAIKMAARFPRLGAARDAILDASGALLAPGFYQSLGEDPGAVVAAGIAALKERYKNALEEKK